MTATPSNARIFFEDIFSEPEATFQKLKALVTSKVPENEWREFKEAWHSTHAGADERDLKNAELKHNWSKAIGAFANSSGGVLIFGIDAPKKTAKNLSLAKDAQALADKLIEWVSDAVVPHVHGILVRPVLKDAGPDGLVVCYIPASRFAPHQSMWPWRQFYIRCQDGSHQCGYAELKRLFQPEISPVLTPWFSFQSSERPGGGWSIGGEVEIKNNGAGSATEVLITMVGAGELNGHASAWNAVKHNTIAARYAIHPDHSVLARVFPFVITEPIPMTLRFRTFIYATNSKSFNHIVELDPSLLIQINKMHPSEKLVLQGTLVNPP